MPIKKICINEKGSRKIIRTFEFMTTMTMLVKIECLPKSLGAYLWCMEEEPKRKPAFEVTFDQNNGSLRYINFFLQDKEFIFKKPINICSEIKEYGIPVFDLSQFSDKIDGWLICEKGKMSAYYCDETICMLNDEVAHEYCVELDKNNTIIFDKNDCISGLLLKSITKEEKKVLKECELL